MEKPFLHAAYLDLRALASYSCCSVRWLRIQLSDSRHPLPHYRIGGKLLVRVEEFDRWMTVHRVLPSPDELDQLVDSVVAQVSAQHRT